MLYHKKRGFSSPEIILKFPGVIRHKMSMEFSVLGHTPEKNGILSQRAAVPKTAGAEFLYPPAAIYNKIWFKAGSAPYPQRKDGLPGKRGLIIMKKGPARFLQAVIVLTGISTLAFLLWEPRLEGRNAHATLFEIYFRDPFLAYAYLASIPFFAALYQAFNVLSYAGQNRDFSRSAVKALRTIKKCALAIIGFVAAGEAFIVLGESDDRAGGVFMGLLIASGSAVIAAAAARFERLLAGGDADPLRLPGARGEPKPGK